MRAVLASVTMLVLVGFVGAADDDKVDTKKLIGKWEVVDKDDAKDKSKIVLEFADKGKFSFSVTIGDKTEKFEGTYKVDGKKVEVEFVIDGKMEKESMEVVKLTDTELTSKDKGKEVTLKKVK